MFEVFNKVSAYRATSSTIVGSNSSFAAKCSVICWTCPSIFSREPGCSSSIRATSKPRTILAAVLRASRRLRSSAALIFLRSSTNAILSSIGPSTSDGSGPGGSVERASRRPVRACLTLLPLLTLTACAIEPQAAREALRDEGYEHVETSAETVFGRPCDWSEIYARHFVANREGKRVSGTLCSTTEAAHDARVRGARVVASRAPAWDAFGGGR